MTLPGYDEIYELTFSLPLGERVEEAWEEGRESAADLLRDEAARLLPEGWLFLLTDAQGSCAYPQTRQVVLHLPQEKPTGWYREHLVASFYHEIGHARYTPIIDEEADQRLLIASERLLARQGHDASEAAAFCFWLDGLLLDERVQAGLRELPEADGARGWQEAQWALKLLWSSCPDGELSSLPHAAPDAQLPLLVGLTGSSLVAVDSLIELVSPAARDAYARLASPLRAVIDGRGREYLDERWAVARPFLEPGLYPAATVASYGQASGLREQGLEAWALPAQAARPDASDA